MLCKTASFFPPTHPTVQRQADQIRLPILVYIASMNCDDFDKPGLRPDGNRHKFKLKRQPRAVKDFARAGYLGFQDHGHKVWYKNVKILPLTK